MKKVSKEELEFYRKYHIPNTGNLNSIKRNAVFIRTSNGLPHEMKKLEVCFELQKNGNNFITEAERSRRKNEERKIVDIVDLSSKKEVEIIDKHESHLDVLKYRANGIIPIMVNPFTCIKCQKAYPIKLKRHRVEHICDNCKG